MVPRRLNAQRPLKPVLDVAMYVSYQLRAPNVTAGINALLTVFNGTIPRTFFIFVFDSKRLDATQA